MFCHSRGSRDPELIEFFFDLDSRFPSSRSPLRRAEEGHGNGWKHSVIRNAEIVTQAAGISRIYQPGMR